jgi:nitroreductase
MTRSFSSRPLPEGVLDEMVRLAARAPSAGKAQGWHLVVLEGEDTSRFWDITLPPSRRDGFRWQRLLDAPTILLPFADPEAYTARYSEPDKAASGLGESPDAWPVPYWTIDASMSVMTLLLSAEDAGLGALLFGVFKGEADLRRSLGVPDRLELLGAIALGYATEDAEHPDRDADAASGQGLSASRPGRAPGEIIHRGGW